MNLPPPWHCFQDYVHKLGRSGNHLPPPRFHDRARNFFCAALFAVGADDLLYFFLGRQIYKLARVGVSVWMECHLQGLRTSKREPSTGCLPAVWAGL